MPAFELTRSTRLIDAPVLVDSPHSGRWYPTDFNASIQFEKLRLAEDLFVDQLYAAAPSFGASLLCANFPRSYIDVNRSVDDIDHLLFSPADPLDNTKATIKSNQGMGLIWRLLAGEAIYNRFLTAEEVQSRIDCYYTPYTNALSLEASRLFQKHGRLLHLNVHSMPDESRHYLGLPPAPLADIVLGDLDGTTCTKATLKIVRDIFESHGFSVAINDPFKGVDLIRKTSDLSIGKESLQIEIKRSIYADTQGHQMHLGAQRVVAAIDDLLRRFCL